jgi:hypothetical protein
MAQGPALLLEELSGQPVRRYSTFDFGRARDEQCLSVVVPESEARLLVFDLREQLSPGFIAFLGTTRWLGNERHDGGVELVVGKGESQFDILRLARADACNYGMDTEALVKKLQSWHYAYGIDIFHAETATIEFTLDKLPADMREFANDVYEFCPDVVDQGIGSVEALEQAIRDHKHVYLWWD